MEATVIFKGDTRQLDAAIARANRQLAALGQGAGAQASARAAAAMAAAARATGNYSTSLQAANNNSAQAAAAAASVSTGLGSVTAAAGNAKTMILALSAAVGGLVLAFVKASDAASEMTARLAVAYDSQMRLSAAMRQVNEIANTTRNGVVEISTLYGKLAMNSERLALSQGEVGKLTETFAKTLKVSGSSASEASSAILQFSQAMASGTLQGDELRSLLENNAYFMQVLTEATGKTGAELKKMGAEGQLTSQMLAKLFTSEEVINKVNRAYERIPVTFADIGTAASNTAIGLAAAFKDGFNVDGGLKKAYTAIAGFAKSAAPFFRDLGKIVGETFAVIGPIIAPVFKAIAGAAKLVADNIEPIAAALKTVVVGAIAFKAVQLATVLYTAAAGAIALQRALGGVGLISGALAAVSVAIQRIGAAAIASSGALAGLRAAALATVAVFGGLAIAVVAVATGLIYLLRAESASEKMSRVLAASKRAVAAGANTAQDAIYKLATAYGAARREALALVQAQLKLSNVRLAQAQGDWIAANAEKNEADKNNTFVGGIKSMFTFGPSPGLEAAKADHNVSKANDNLVKEMATNKALRDAIAAPDPSIDVAAPSAVSGPSSNAGASGPKSDPKGDFWENLEKQKALQERLLTIGGKALEIENERFAKVQEYEGIVKRAILPDEQKRLDLLLAQTRAAALTVAENERYRVSALDSANELAKMNLESSGLRGRELSEQSAILDLKNDYLKAGTDINTLGEDTVKKLIEQRTQEAAINYELERRKRAMEDVARIRAATPQAQMRNASERYEDGLAELAIQRRSGGIDKKEYDAAKNGLYNETIGEVKSKMLSEWGSAITDLGDQIGGKFGKAIEKIGGVVDEWADIAKGGFGDGLIGSISKMADLIDGMDNPLDLISDYSGETADLLKNGIPDIIDAIKGLEPAIKVEGKRTMGFAESFRDSFGKATKSIWNGGKAGEDGLKTLGQSFKSMFGKGGDFMQGLGSMLGQAQAGAQTGKMVDGVLKGLGINSSKTGAQIGGAIGSFIPIPGGAFIGSAIGGIVGGMFKKKPYGTAGFDLVDGEVTVGKVAGNKAKDREASRQLAEAVAGGINDIARRLGASVTSAPGVTIGTYKGDYRVSESGYTGKLKVANGAKDFGKDADAAVAYAIKSALSKGILDGISAFSKRVIQSATDLDSAVSMAEGYEKVLKDLAALENPLKAAFSGVGDDILKLIEMMKKAGATADELGNAQRYYSLKLKDVYESEISPFRNLNDELTRSAKSPFAALQDDLLKFNNFRADIAAGRAIDSDAFTTLASRISSGSAAVYGGSTEDTAAIRAMLLTASNEAQANITREYEATVSAINLNTQATDITNSYLQQMLVLMQNGAGMSSGGGTAPVNNGGGAANGGNTLSALDIMNQTRWPSVNGVAGGPLV